VLHFADLNAIFKTTLISLSHSRNHRRVHFSLIISGAAIDPTYPSKSAKIFLGKAE